MVKGPTFDIRFWGVRGTVPCPCSANQRYGGNTSCIEIVCGSNRLIFDAGTGLRELGREMGRKGGAVNATIFLTHTHLDHINGLPFFRPAYEAGNSFSLWAGHLQSQGMNIETVLSDLMAPQFFPVPLDQMAAKWEFHDFSPGEQIRPHSGIEIETVALNHPGGAVGYKIRFDGRAACIITDTEHEAGKLDQSVVDFVRGSEVMVYDATYTDDQYPNFVGWGHSTWQEGVRVCKAAGLNRLITFHHDPERDDDSLDAIASQVGDALPGAIVAREKLVVAV